MENRIVVCRRCGCSLRLPAGMGLLTVTCPRCGYMFQFDSGPRPAGAGGARPTPPPQYQAPRTANAAASANNRRKTAAPKKKLGALPTALLILAVFFAVSTFVSSQMSNQGKPNGNPSGSSITDVLNIPEGIPVIIDGRMMWDPGTTIQEYYDAGREFNGQIDEAIRNMEPKICVVSVIDLAYDTLGEEFGYPYFWVDGIASTSPQWIKWEEKSVCYHIWQFTYKQDAGQRDRMQAQIDAAVADYMRLIPADADEWEASKIIHDELVRRVVYDQSLTGDHVHDIYGPLVQGSSVCQGYAYAFSYLMKHWTEMTGRDYVQGYNLYPTVVSDTHAWNIIRAASANDANMDVTWDDPDISDRYGNPYILYDFFGLSTKEIETIDAHAVAGSNQLTDSAGAVGSSFNYHKHEGYYLNEFDLDKLVSVFAGQYDSGTNVLTVRFEYQADFQRMEDNLNTILSRIGYGDYYSYTWRDELLIFNVLLYPAR